MMKNKLYGILCAVAVMLTSWSCITTPEAEGKLSLSPENQELDFAEQSNGVDVEATGLWVATCEEDWLTLNIDSGDGDGRIEYTVEENLSASEREAVITVMSGELIAEAFVLQAAAVYNVSTTKVKLSPEADFAEVNVFSPEAWTASTSAEWLTLEWPEENAGKQTALKILAEANSAFEERTAEVKIKVGNSVKTIIAVTQERVKTENFVIRVESADFDVAQDTLKTDIFGATYTFFVGTPSNDSNVSWNAKTEDSFITMGDVHSGEGSGSFTATVAFNNEGERVGTIIIKGKSTSKTYELSIKVHQTYFECFYNTDELWSAEPYGDTLNIAPGIEPALDLVYRSDVDWISFDAEGNAIVQYNPLKKSRAATVEAVLAMDTTIVAATFSLSQAPLYTITIPLQCNTYVTPQDPTLKAEPSFASSILPGAGSISSDAVKKGGQMGSIRAWRKVYITSQAHQLSFYFRTETMGELNLGMIGGLAWDNDKVADTAWIDVEVEDIRRRVMVTNKLTSSQDDIIGIDTIFLGQFNISKKGYVRVNIIPVDATGRNLPYISDFALGGTGINNTTRKGTVLSFVSKEDVASSDPHWIMRGPSGNLSYDVPAYTEYFYNEIYVDKGYDFSGGYYMTTGGSAFYMGLQPNDNGRTVLFSAWDTEDKREGYQCEVVRYGATEPNSFGHEGSGKQTFLKYEWKAETTYATMAHVRPEVDENGEPTGATLYTGYFWSADDVDRNDNECVEGWHLVAEYRRPHEVVYYKGAHSFCENFSPYRGWIPRRVNFTNQWMIDKNGEWHEVTTAYLGVDGTGDSGMRKDFSGGVDERGFFYLTNIGYIDEYSKPRTKYTRQPTGKKPDIPFEKLAKLGTWVE